MNPDTLRRASRAIPLVLIGSILFIRYCQDHFQDNGPAETMPGSTQTHHSSGRSWFNFFGSGNSSGGSWHSSGSSFSSSRGGFGSSSSAHSVGS